MIIVRLYFSRRQMRCDASVRWGLMRDHEGPDQWWPPSDHPMSGGAMSGCCHGPGCPRQTWSAVIIFTLAGVRKTNPVIVCELTRAQHEFLLIVSSMNWINQSSLTFHKQISSEYDKCLHTKWGNLGSKNENIVGLFQSKDKKRRTLHISKNAHNSFILWNTWVL